MLYLLLTDRLPYTGIQDWELERFDFKANPLPPPSQLNYMVDAKLDAIMARALAADPADRYPNAQQLLANLESWAPSTGPRSSTQASDDAVDISRKSALGPQMQTDDLGARALWPSRRLGLPRDLGC